MVLMMRQGQLAIRLMKSSMSYSAIPVFLITISLCCRGDHGLHGRDSSLRLYDPMSSPILESKRRRALRTAEFRPIGISSGT